MGAARGRTGAGRRRPLRRRAQDLLVGLRPRTPHVVATGSDHDVQLRDPDLTIATVRLVLERARRAGRR
jgi:hypothetical protein